MSITESFTICPDKHRCENGSLCVEHPKKEGSYYCDCDESDFIAAYAGLYCEHKATDYCDFSLSKNSFCTNGGWCKEQVGPDEIHQGCNCLKGYVGEHCQFIDGSMPEGWPFDEDDGVIREDGGGGGGGIAGGAIFAITLAAVGAVLVGAFYVKRKMILRKNAASKPIDSPELSLEADGDVLKDAMSASGANVVTNGVAAKDEVDENEVI